MQKGSSQWWDGLGRDLEEDIEANS